MASIVALLIAFAAGSVPTALLMGRVRGVDIREHGSGNVGATNAFRVLGKPWGLTCLAIDIAKGWIPALIFAGPAWAPGGADRAIWMLAVGLTAVAGHSFSPWLGWKGGKGVATSLGVFLAVAPLSALVCVVMGLGIIWRTGFVSLASIAGSVMLPISILVLAPGGEKPWGLVGATAALGAFVIWKHRINIEHLKNGTEARISIRPGS